MRKIKSGVYGLNPLLDGGINENSTTVVIGPAGAGKTTFATQFIRRGLESGTHGIYISLDENEEQIIREAEEMGWDQIHKFLKERKLVFIDASGKKFSDFIKKELADFVDSWEGAKCRVVIDPLTPVIWATDDRYEQRELFSFLLRQLRTIGTLLCTLEEHGTVGDLSGPETVIPMYLSDCVIHLRYRALEETESRSLKIIKCRNSRHDRSSHRYEIVRGLGLFVHGAEQTKREPTGIREALTEELTRRSPDISQAVMDRIKRVDVRLTQEDILGLTPPQIISYILEDAEEDEDA